MFGKKKAAKAGLLKEKKFHITQKTLNKEFKRDHGTSFTTEVKKAFQEEGEQINKGGRIREAKENIEQQ